MTWSGAGSYRMLDRVLDHGLQDQVRHLRREACRFDLELYCESIAKADLFYLQVTANEFELFLQRDRLLVGVFERKAQEIPEPRNHGISFGWILQDERRDRM